MLSGGYSPALGKQKFPFKSTGHFQLRNKYMKWNNKLSTPCDKSPFVNICPRSNTTDSEKLNEIVKRLSKSEESVNSVRINLNAQVYPFPALKKRSISDSDLKKEKRKVPVTPMCLKRTIHKAKSKKIKTSEELELEKIAELQSLTLKHLRYNEITIKKLRLKQKPNYVPKIPAKAVAEEKPIKNFQKDNETIMEKINYTRNMRSKTKESSVNVSNVKCTRPKAISSSSGVIPSKLLQSFVSIQLDEIKKANSKKCNSELELPPKYTAHSGLFFSMNNSKKATLKPFNFLEKTKNIGSEVFSKSSINVSKMEENISENKVTYSHSMYESHLRNGNKENELTLKTPRTDADYAKKTFKTHNSHSLYASHRSKENYSTLKIPHTDTGYDKKIFKFH